MSLLITSALGTLGLQCLEYHKLAKTWPPAAALLLLLLVLGVLGEASPLAALEEDLAAVAGAAAAGGGGGEVLGREVRFRQHRQPLRRGGDQVGVRWEGVKI